MAVDWEGGAGLPEWIPKAVEMPLYLHATANTRLIGRQIGIMVLNLAEHFGKEDMAQNTHVIRHSLGGQIAGYAGEHLRLMNHPLARITGTITFFKKSLGFVINTNSVVNSMPQWGVR